jgi:hypothetical protein
VAASRPLGTVRAVRISKDADASLDAQFDCGPDGAGPVARRDAAFARRVAAQADRLHPGDRRDPGRLDQEVFGIARDVAVPFSPVIGANNEELLSGLPELAPRQPLMRLLGSSTGSIAITGLPSSAALAPPMPLIVTWPCLSRR